MTNAMQTCKKCIVCGHFVIGIGANPPNAHEMASKMVEPVCKWVENDQYMQKSGEPIYCELCLTGLMGNGGKYMWNGEELMVFDENDEEYHEPTKNTYVPHKNSQIWFVFNNNTHRWDVMPQ